MEPLGDEVPASSRTPRPRARGGETVRLHVLALVGVVLCTVAFWFELHRAEGGNELSWAYVFEWPLLAVFVVYMWWKFLHPEDAAGAASEEIREGRTREIPPEASAQYDAMLAAWQEHQRALHEAQRAADEALRHEADAS
ncbi:MAG: hypothetical protein ACP5PB_04910 [Acidimicrobiales bacterium]